ncbi:MAG: hypothetical protein ACRCX2_20035 [Paraclostridium sp.]
MRINATMIRKLSVRDFDDTSEKWKMYRCDVSIPSILKRKPYQHIRKTSELLDLIGIEYSVELHKNNSERGLTTYATADEIINAMNRYSAEMVQEQNEKSTKDEKEKDPLTQITDGIKQLRLTAELEAHNKIIAELQEKNRIIMEKLKELE